MKRLEKLSIVIFLGVLTLSFGSISYANPGKSESKEEKHEFKENKKDFKEEKHEFKEEKHELRHEDVDGWHDYRDYHDDYINRDLCKLEESRFGNEYMLCRDKDGYWRYEDYYWEHDGEDY